MSNERIPMKGDIIINPKTQRPVKVGSRTWMTLVKEGIVEGRYRDNNELAPLPENDREAERKIQEIDQTLPRGVQAVKGRGKYRGKIVKRKTSTNPDGMSKYSAKIASKVLRDNIEELTESGDNISETLEQLILREMTDGDDAMYSKRRPGRPKGTKNKSKGYQSNDNWVEQNVDEGSEESEEESGEEEGDSEDY